MRMKKDWKACTWALIACFLLLPALLIHLGLMTFIDDEAIRSLVALEMKLSGNFITPTLHGVFYYNKPPLFNWILLVFFELSGKFDEFTARIPTVLALLGYGVSVFLIFRRHYGTQRGLLAAFLLITCGRVLFWDSILALIDITFSWVIFGLFMTVYHYFSREKWLTLFVWAYALAAIGFLLKGLPSVVFLGFTLLGYFIYRGAFRRLFSWAHVFGGLVFLIIVGVYYAFYLQYNSLDTVFQTLFTESSKRTVVNYGWGKTILHLFTFPFEMIYHFFPWSLMIVYILDRSVWVRIREDRFAEFMTVVFFANIWVYWSSPEVYPRYLLMFAPLIFGVLLDLHIWHEERKTIQFRIVRGVWLVLIVLIAVLFWAPFFTERAQVVSWWFLKSGLLGLAGAALLWRTWRQISMIIPLTVLALLLGRIGFNWFVLPDRNSHDFGDLCRQSSLEVGAQFAAQPVFVYKDTDMQPTNSFYLTVARGAIIPRKQEGFDTSAVYLLDPEAYPGLKTEKIGEFKVRHGQLTFDVVRFK